MATEKRIVHVLRHGVTLCEITDPPSTWPDNARWCALDDWEENCNCGVCRARAELYAQALEEEKNGTRHDI